MSLGERTLVREKTSPRLAVLVCTHNGERFLGEQLDSLIAQYHSPCRVSIHDWASADGTLAVIDSRRDRWPAGCTLEVVHHDSAPGACRSFLAALEHVLRSHDDFDYLLFCDQDDIWLPGKLTAFAQQVQADPRVDLIHCDVALIDARGQRLAHAYLRSGGVFGRPMDMSHPSALFVNTVGGMSMAVSRRLLLRALPAFSLDGWVMHDWAVTILVHVLEARVAFIPESLVEYRQHDANVVGSVQAKRSRSLLGSLRHARTYVRAVQRQYRTCTELPGLLGASRCLDPRIGRLGVAWAVMRSRAMPPLRALKVAAGYLAFWG